MPYIALIKYGGIVVLIIAWNLSVYHYGGNHVRDQWQAQDAKRILEIEQLNKKVVEKTEQNTAYAEFIQGDWNAKSIEISKLHSDLLDAQRMRKTNRVCTNRVPQVVDTGSPTINTANEAELSAEFEKKLISESLRADQVSAYAESANKFILNLCQTGQVTCQNPGDIQ